MEEPLDVRTLTTLVAVIAVVLLLAQALLWRIQRSIPGPGHWVAMSASLCVGLTLISARGAIHDLLSVVMGNVALVFGLLVMYRGTRHFRGHRLQRWEWRLALALLGGTALVQTYFTFVSPSLRVRIVFVSAVIALLLLVVALQVLRGAPAKARATSIFTASMFGLLGGFLILRVLHYLVAPYVPASLMTSTFWQSSTFLLVALCAIGWTLGLLLLGAQRIELELREAKVVLERLAATDELTAIHNRRSFFDCAGKAVASAKRHNTPLAVVMFDLDHFKDVNDQHGHAVGDEVLRASVDRCRCELREADTFARMGGEEFAILAPHTDKAGAQLLAERLRSCLEEKPVDTSVGPVYITASFGVTVVGADAPSFEAALLQVDHALYAAKSSGRNCINTGDGDELESIGRSFGLQPTAG